MVLRRRSLTFLQDSVFIQPMKSSSFTTLNAKPPPLLYLSPSSLTSISTSSIHGNFLVKIISSSSSSSKFLSLFYEFFKRFHFLQRSFICVTYDLTFFIIIFICVTYDLTFFIIFFICVTYDLLTFFFFFLEFLLLQLRHRLENRNGTSSVLGIGSIRTERGQTEQQRLVTGKLQVLINRCLPQTGTKRSA